MFFVSKQTLRKPLGAAAVLAVTGLSVAGCGSSGSGGLGVTFTATPGPSSAAPAPSSPAAAGAPSSPTASAAGSAGSAAPLAGSALQTKLGAAPLPAGYTVVSSSQESSDGAPSSPDVADGGLTLQDCSDLTNASSQTLTSDYEASYATYQIQNASTTVTVVVADYFPGDAQQQMSEVSTLVGKCGHYQASALSGGNVTMTASSSAPSGLGDQAMDIHLNATTSGYVEDEFLLVRTGNRIVAMDDSNAGGGMATLTSLAGPYLSALA
jgi:hypothetical protein